MALIRRWWLIVIMTLTIGGAGYHYFSDNQPVPIYSATSSIIVSEDKVNMNTMNALVSEPIVLKVVAETLAIERSVSQLSGQVSSEAVEGSQIIKVSVQDLSAEHAVTIANTLTSVFPEVVHNTLGYSEIEVLSQADLNQGVSQVFTPNNRINYYGFILGALLGVGLALLWNTFDTKLRSEREVESVSELPVLGTVSKVTRSTMKQSGRKTKRGALRGETIV